MIWGTWQATPPQQAGVPQHHEVLSALRFARTARAGGLADLFELRRGQLRTTLRLLGSILWYIIVYDNLFKKSIVSVFL